MVTEKQLTETVSRIIDDEAGVVIYTYDSYHAGGICCIPIKKTSLNRSKKR